MKGWKIWQLVVLGVVAFEIYEHTQGRCLYDRMIGR